MFNKLREPVSGLTHFFAAIASAVGVVGLVAITYHSPARLFSSVLYGISLVLMFSASAAYHMIKARPEVVKVLRKLDHSAIYFLIAGTYTPICIYYFDGFWRTGILAIVWSMAIIGITVKVFVINAPRWLSAGIYLVMGWVCIMAIGQMLAAMPLGALAWLFAGGLLFSVGAMVYIFKKPDFYPGVFGFHEVWHIFVILGSLAHFIVIFAYVGLLGR